MNLIWDVLGTEGRTADGYCARITRGAHSGRMLLVVWHPDQQEKTFRRAKDFNDARRMAERIVEEIRLEVLTGRAA